MDSESKIKELEAELNAVKEKLQLANDELQTTKEHLKKYTAPSRNRKYYDNNKEIAKERSRIYKKTTNYKPTPEKVKEYARRAYLKKKEKLKKELEEQQSTEIV